MPSPPRRPLPLRPQELEAPAAVPPVGVLGDDAPRHGGGAAAQLVDAGGEVEAAAEVDAAAVLAALGVEAVEAVAAGLRVVGVIVVLQVGLGAQTKVLERYKHGKLVVNYSTCNLKKALSS